MKKVIVLTFGLVLLLVSVVFAQKPEAVIKKAPIAPVIDGVADAVWASANTYNINLPMGTPTLGNLGTTTWKGLWRDEGIYILLQVNDDVFFPAYAGANPWETWMYDRLEIYFDVNSVLVDGLGPKINNSGHYSITPEFVAGQINGTPVTAWDGVVNAFRVTNPAYVGEYFIPFTKLLDKDGIEVPKNATIGFDVTVLDRDSEPADRPSANWSNNGTAGGSWDNMDYCGTVVLEGIPVSEITISADGGATTIETDNGTLQMTASILPVDATHKNLNWTVENGTGKAKINDTGLLTALMNGVVNVKAAARDGSGVFAMATITISGQVVQISEINLIKNGNFNDVTSGFPDLWSFYSNSGDPIPIVEDDVVVCYPKANPPNFWEYQLMQFNLKALPNIPYTFSFTAWADADRTIVVRFIDTANEYKALGISTDTEANNGESFWFVNLTTAPKTYTLHVVFNQIVENTIQLLAFQLNSTSDIVYIDDVTLVRDEELTGAKFSATSAIMGATEGSSVTVNMVTTANWTANSDQSWLAVSPGSGTGNQKLTFTANANTSLGTRKAIITVSAAGFPEPQTITITQDGSNAPVIVTAGNLSSVLTAEVLGSIAKLTLTGTIDARDFKTMRDNMPMLAEVDLSGISVVAYTGTGGTAGSGSITYPANVIPEMAFSLDDWTGQTRIKSIVIPETITSIGAKAFADCKGLTSMIIPPLVTNIGFDAFRNGWSFTSINIPPSVNFLWSAFRYFAGLINVDANNPDYSSIDGVLFTKNQTSLILCPTSKTGSYIIPSSVVKIETIAFAGCSQLTSIQIPSSVQSIYWHAFSGCSSLTSLNIPSSVTMIKESAFDWCSALTSITVEWPTPLDLNTSPNVFRGVNKATCILNVPFGSKAAYQATNQWQDFENIVEVLNVTPGQLSTILTVEQLATLTKLTLSGTIDARDFKTMRDNMPLLAEIDLSEVNIVAYSGTEGTSSFGTVDYPADVIAECAFFYSFLIGGKNSLTSIIFPSSTTAIGQNAFYACNGLTAVSFTSKIKNIDDDSFSYCQGLTVINIPVSLTRIGDRAFMNCTGLVYVDAAHPNYSSIDGVLYNKHQTILIQCPTSKTGNLIIPSSVTSVGEFAFSYCNGLNSVTIPSSVTTIGYRAFYNCNKVSSINLNSPLPINLNTSSDVFQGVNKSTCTLNVPFGSKTAYQTANQWQDFTNIVERDGFQLSSTSSNIAAAEGSTAIVDITANVAWTASSDQAWLTVSPTSGNGNQALTFTAEANLSRLTRTAIVTVSATGVDSETISVTQYGAPNLNRIAFIYSSDLTAANSFKSLLETIFSIDLININNISSTDFSNYNLIIVSSGTSSGYEWGTTSTVSIIENSNLPIIGLGFGGASIFQQLGLTINWENGWIDFTNNSTNIASTSIYCVNPHQYIFNVPNKISIPANSIITLYNMAGHIGEYQPDLSSNAHLIGREPNDANHYSLVSENSKYWLWGFNNSPSDMTQTGKDLFINLINLSLNPEPFINLANTAININSIANSTSIVDVTANVAWTASSDQTWLTVNPTSGSGNQTLTFTAEVNPLFGTRQATVTVSATGLDSQTITITQAAMPAPSAVVKNASIAPVIDGIIDDVWADANTYNIDKNFGNELPTLGEPGQTTWKALWNNEGIFILLTVTDNEWYPSYIGGGNPWEYDKTEIYFDVNYVLKDAQGAMHNNGHYQITPTPELAKIDGTPTTGGDGVIWSFKVDNPNYIQELFIPFSKLIDKNGIGVDKTATIGFDVTIVDRDARDTGRKRAVWANVGAINESWLNMDDVGTITLANASQSISLNAGWNIMSLRVMPENVNLKDIFQPLIDAGKLKKVMDESGKVIENWGYFGGWQNSIVELKNTEGYKINVTSPVTIEVTGIPTQLPFDIPLNAGWNIISWPSPNEQNGKAVFQALIDAGKLKKVMDEEGKVIEDWGYFGSWQNSIGNLKPGEGYKVNVTGDCILTINETGTKSEKIIPELIASSHFIPAFKGNGTDHMNINLLNLAESGIMEGDEIGIFDVDICVGSAQISNLTSLIINHQSSIHNQFSSISIPVSAADGIEGKNGYSEGNPINLKLFRNGKEYPLTIQPLNQSKTVFEKGSSLFAQVDLATGLEGIPVSSTSEINCYPNPFSDEITVEINFAADAQVQVEVLNQLGQMVKMIATKQLLPEGLHKVTWDGRNAGNGVVAPGIYYVRIGINDTIIHRKIVLSK